MLISLSYFGFFRPLKREEKVLGVSPMYIPTGILVLVSLVLSNIGYLGEALLAMWAALTLAALTLVSGSKPVPLEAMVCWAASLVMVFLGATFIKAWYPAPYGLGFLGLGVVSYGLALFFGSRR